jgi:hypothetical protein
MHLGVLKKVFFNELSALVLDRKTQHFVYGGIDGGTVRSPLISYC